MATVRTLIGNIKGKDGATPYIGANKNWFINGIDQGVCAEGSGGLSDVPKLYIPYVPQDCTVDENFFERAGAHIDLEGEYLMRNPSTYNSSTRYGMGKLGVAVEFIYDYVSEGDFKLGGTTATFDIVEYEDMLPVGYRGDWLKIKCVNEGIEGNRLTIGIHFNDEIETKKLYVPLPISNAKSINVDATYLYFEDMTNCAKIPGVHQAYKDCSIVPQADKASHANLADKARTADVANCVNVQPAKGTGSPSNEQSYTQGDFNGHGFYGIALGVVEGNQNEFSSVVLTAYIPPEDGMVHSGVWTNVGYMRNMGSGYRKVIALISDNIIKEVYLIKEGTEDRVAASSWFIQSCYRLPMNALQ